MVFPWSSYGFPIAMDKLLDLGLDGHPPFCVQTPTSLGLPDRHFCKVIEEFLISWCRLGGLKGLL